MHDISPVLVGSYLGEAPSQTLAPPGATVYSGGVPYVGDDFVEWPVTCPATKNNGHACMGTPTSTGLCNGHTKRTMRRLVGVMAGE